MIQNNSPLLSVVIPYYNTPFNLFIEAIESMLAQSYTNWEVVIVNDGNTTKNKKLLEEYVRNIDDNRITILHLDKNYGPSTSYNKGIEAAKGEIVTWLDADDIYLPWYCKEIVDYFSKNPDLKIIVVDPLFYIKLGSIKKIYINELFADLLSGKEKQENLLEIFKHNIEKVFPLISFKKEVFNTIRFDSEISLSEDDDLYFQILNNNNLLSKTMVVPIAGYLYRLYASRDRLTHQLKIRFQDTQKIINKYSSNDGSLAYKTVKRYKECLENWRFCSYLYNYFNNGSIFNYIKSTFLHFQSAKDRIGAIKALIRTILVYRILIPTLGVNLRYLGILFNVKDNKYKMVKNIFCNHLSKVKNEKEQHYIAKTLKRTFK